MRTIVADCSVLPLRDTTACVFFDDTRERPHTIPRLHPAASSQPEWINLGLGAVRPDRPRRYPSHSHASGYSNVKDQFGRISWCHRLHGTLTNSPARRTTDGADRIHLIPQGAPAERRNNHQPVPGSGHHSLGISIESVPRTSTRNQPRPLQPVTSPGSPACQLSSSIGLDLTASRVTRPPCSPSQPHQRSRAAWLRSSAGSWIIRRDFAPSTFDLTFFRKTAGFSQTPMRQSLRAINGAVARGDPPASETL